MCRARDDCFSSHLDRQPAVSPVSGALPILVQDRICWTIFQKQPLRESRIKCDNFSNHAIYWSRRSTGAVIGGMTFLGSRPHLPIVWSKQVSRSCMAILLIM